LRSARSDRCELRTLLDAAVFAALTARAFERPRGLWCKQSLGMHIREQIALLEQARAMIANGGTDLSLPGGAIPVDRYTDAARIERERQVLFRTLPILVGFASQVRSAGDWFTHDATGVPILCVRSRDGRLRAFLNVCRHRGARLATKAEGCAAAKFTCGFHGWTYRDDGRLLGVSLPESFPDLDCARIGLVELPVAERYGLVFVVPAPRRGSDVDDDARIDAFLGPLIAELGSFGTGSYVMKNAATSTRKLNWKLHMDATQEAYHLPFLHAATAGAGYFRNCSLLTHRAPHARVVLPGPSIAALGDGERSTWRILDHAAIAYALFPNTTLLLYMGYVQMLRIFPVDTDTSIVQTAMLVPDGVADADEEHRQRCSFETYLSTMAEDLAICEQMQANMRSGANESLRIGRAEGLLLAFHDAVEAMLAASPAPLPRP
jgi:phenylpropionate dioxygenase-like ring-hydroxylating dioxygenase large terminal subunit